MMDRLDDRIGARLRARHGGRRRARLLGALALIAAVATGAALVHPALTLGFGADGGDRGSRDIQAVATWVGEPGEPEGASPVAVAELWSDESGQWAQVPGTAPAALEREGSWSHLWRGVPERDAVGRTIGYRVKETHIIADGRVFKVTDRAGEDAPSPSADGEAGSFSVSYAEPADGDVAVPRDAEPVRAADLLSDPDAKGDIARQLPVVEGDAETVPAQVHAIANERMAADLAPGGEGEGEGAQDHPGDTPESPSTGLPEESADGGDADPVGPALRPVPPVGEYQIAFTVYESGDSSVLIDGATFELVSEDRAVVHKMVSGPDGSIVDEDTGQPVILPNGTYRMRQLTSDGEHNLMSGELVFTVAGRPDNYAIENPLKDSAAAVSDVRVAKVWEDSLPGATGTIELVRTNLATGERAVGAEIGPDATWEVPYSDQRQEHVFSGLRKYDDQGDRYFYSVEEKEMPGCYGVVTQDGAGGYTVTNHEGYQAGTVSDGTLWASDSSNAYLIGRRPDGSSGIVGTIAIGHDAQGLFGHGIAYDAQNDVLYGVYNGHRLVAISHAQELARNNGTIFTGPNNTRMNTSVARAVDLAGDALGSPGSSATHALAVSNDGRHLFLKSSTMGYIYVIPIEDVAFDALANGSKLRLDGLPGVSTIKLGMTSPTMDDGDIVQLDNGDLIFTAHPRSNLVGPATVWLVPFNAASGTWGKARNVGTIAREYNEGGTKAGQTEGLARYGGRIWFSATRERDERFYLYPLAEEVSASNGSGHVYAVDTAAGIDISDGVRGVTLSDMAGSGPSDARRYVGSAVSKIWIGDRPEIRPDRIQATLHTRVVEADGSWTDRPYLGPDGQKVQLELTRENGWQASIKASDEILPKYGADGAEIWYVWKEEAVPPGYEGSVDESGHTLTNVYRPQISLPQTGGPGIRGPMLAGLALTLAALACGCRARAARRRSSAM